MKTNEKKVADRLVGRMSAFLRVLKTKNERLIAASAKLLRNHARVGPFGLMFSKGDLRRLEKDFGAQAPFLLQTAHALHAESRAEAAAIVASIYELFVPEHAGILSAQFEISAAARVSPYLGNLERFDRERPFSQLETIAKDRRRPPEVRRQAMHTLFEAGGVERAVKLAVSQLTDAMKKQHRSDASDLMLLIGEFGCFWSPEEEQRRWAKEDRERERADGDDFDLERRRRDDWMM